MASSSFSIKSNVLRLDTAQKVYSVNKGLFLGVFPHHGLIKNKIFKQEIGIAEKTKKQEGISVVVM